MREVSVCQTLNPLRRESRLSTMRNKAVKSDLKTALKKADAAVAENAENKEEVVRAAIKKVDMACTKGIMHKNAAARKVSQLAKKLG